MFDEKVTDLEKTGSGTITEAELPQLASAFKVTLPEEIEFPYSVKLTKKHTLVIERRGSQRVTDSGLVNLLNWRTHENMHEPLQRIS